MTADQPPPAHPRTVRARFRVTAYTYDQLVQHAYAAARTFAGPHPHRVLIGDADAHEQNTGPRDAFGAPRGPRTTELIYVATVTVTVLPDLDASADLDPDPDSDSDPDGPERGPSRATVPA